MKKRIFAGRKAHPMLDILRYIVSFVGTFLILSSVTMLVVQAVVCAFTGKWEMKENTDYRIVIIGILVALLLIPYYYFPA